MGQPSPYVDSLRDGLKEFGWVEGRNLTLHLYWATGRNDMEAVARELLKIEPDVVVTQELMAYAMRAVKSQTPVVFGFSGDPVDGKLVESFSRPGGTFTGMSYLALDLVGKRIELLKEWIPQIRRLAILARPQHPGDPKERARRRRRRPTSLAWRSSTSLTSPSRGFRSANSDHSKLCFAKSQTRSATH
jgi:putative ABC transport system substrate-binding protein